MCLKDTKTHAIAVDMGFYCSVAIAFNWSQVAPISVTRASSLERHEKTRKHLREVQEIQRLSQLSEDPDQAEFWKEHVEVDWQVNPTKSMFEEMMETSEEMAWYAYIQKIDQWHGMPTFRRLINQRRERRLQWKKLLPSTDEVEDPRQYCNLYWDIFQGETVDNTTQEVPDILDQMLEQEVDPTSLERMVTELENNLIEDMPTENGENTESELRVYPVAGASEQDKVEVTEAEVEELEKLLQIALEAVEQSETITSMEVASEEEKK